jgi:hypothetical protein
MLIDVKSLKGIEPSLKDLTQCSEGLPTKENKKQNKNNNLMFIQVTKN